MFWKPVQSDYRKERSVTQLHILRFGKVFYKENCLISMFNWANWSKSALLCKNGVVYQPKTLTEVFHCHVYGKFASAASFDKNQIKTSKVHQSVRFRGNTAGYLSDPRNTGKPQSGVNFDTLGSWNNRLGLDVNIEQSVESGTLIPDIHAKSVGVSSVIGRRKTNEDRVIVQDLSPSLILLAVFDGHGGEVCAAFYDFKPILTFLGLILS